MDTIISASILSADLCNLERDIKRAEKAGCDYIHFDVMDGVFVNNISYGIPVLKSVSKVNHEVHTSGTLLNMRLDPTSVEGDMGLRRIAQIIRTFVDLNIYHIQFNVVSSEVLRNAQDSPDEYKSLIVRVAGYSAYFTELCKEMQDDIIHRTIHSA